MLNFLTSYSKATSLDDIKFNSFFIKGVKKADFLLFEETTICEYKEIENFNVKQRVEYLVKKDIHSELDFKRDFHNTINKALSNANQQIKETKKL